MIVVDWNSNVNTRILRQSGWDLPSKFIADKTRCGVRKVRMANTQEPVKFSIKMRFTPTERNAFVSWFKNDLMDGTYDFWFKDITKETEKTLAYRFVEGSGISFSNPSGKVVDVSMSWESVDGVEKDEQ